MAPVGAAREPAPAKLNLALHVRRRRADSYHDLETLFAFTRFGDELVAHPADDWQLTLTGPMAGAAGPAADNLVLRAARAHAEAAGSARRFHLHLAKHIPVAAGLGGGSADAAAALRLMDRLTGAALGPERLRAIGATLGADVPACIASEPSFGSGVGDALRPGPWLAGTPVLLANPRVAVPTGPVFAGWDGVDRGALGADWRAGRNDLAAPAVAIAPVIADVLAWLESLPGMKLARMSGSGASCLALFDGPVPAVVPPADWWLQATTLI